MEGMTSILWKLPPTYSWEILVLGILGDTAILWWMGRSTTSCILASASNVPRLMTLRTALRLDHPSEVLHPPLFMMRSHRLWEMRNLTCPLSILNPFSLFYYQWPAAAITPFFFPFLLAPLTTILWVICNTFSHFKWEIKLLNSIHELGCPHH